MAAQRKLQDLQRQDDNVIYLLPISRSTRRSVQPVLLAQPLKKDPPRWVTNALQTAAFELKFLAVLGIFGFLTIQAIWGAYQAKTLANVDLVPGWHFGDVLPF